METGKDYGEVETLMGINSAVLAPNPLVEPEIETLGARGCRY